MFRSFAPELQDGVSYSLDKAKRWELVEELKKTEKEQAENASTSSSSGSSDDDDDDDDSSDHSSDSDEGTRKVAVAEGKWHLDARGETAKALDRVGQVIRDSPENERLEQEEVVEWTTNRKGQQRKVKRKPGKNVNNAPTHHNAHKAHDLQIGGADEIFHVQTQMHADHIYARSPTQGCSCPICNPAGEQKSRNKRRIDNVQFAAL